MLEKTKKESLFKVKEVTQIQLLKSLVTSNNDNIKRCEHTTPTITVKKDTKFHKLRNFISSLKAKQTFQNVILVYLLKIVLLFLEKSMPGDKMGTT